MGKVVVASKLPGIDRMITSKSVGGCLFDPADFNNMTDSVKWLIENPEEHKDIAKRGMEHAKINPGILSCVRWQTILKPGLLCREQANARAYPKSILLAF